MIFSDIFFELSVRSVRLNFLRSLLAVIGIIIGVIAITSMGMLGASIELSVSDTLSDVGDSIVIFPASAGTTGGPGGSGVSSTAMISKHQVKQIIQAAGQNRVIALHTDSKRIQVGPEKGWATVYGIEPDDIPPILELEDGIYLKGTKGALVGYTIADDYDLKVGSRITIGEEGNTDTVRVVGILKERGIGIDLNPDNAIIVSTRWYTSKYGKEGEYDQVNVIIRDIGDTEQVKEAIEKKLNRKEDVVSVLDTKQFLEAISEAISTISLFTTAIGGISLIVAAVSIFNVMMISVTERIKEIGILRSMGTRKSEVRRMFLYEAFILGFFGSTIGALLSIGGGYIAVSIILEDTKYFFSPESLTYIPFGMFIGIFICILSGIYPAWKASDLDPIEALASE